MRSYRAKRIVAILLLGLSIYLAASTLLPHGGNKKNQWHVFDCRGVLRKIKVGKQVGFGCNILEEALGRQKPRSLRSWYPPSPPPPVKNKQKSMTVPAAPPKQIV